jgi:NADH-quinone oxidoreductase subunit E
VGKYVIQVCTNISCLLCSAEQIMEHLCRRLKIRPGETTPDKKYTLLEVECLGSCGTSPVVQINDTYYEDLTPAKLDNILDGLE